MSSDIESTGASAEERLDTAAEPHDRWPVAAWACVMLAVGVLAYSNSVRCGLVFDDRRGIINNVRIRKLWPIWKVLEPPRPMVNLSLAINYRLDGSRRSPWGYHALNVAIHLAAALALFGVLRRTLLCGRFAGRFSRAATPLALAAGTIWMAHPLQTQSVTYTIQRAESMMGLFYLLTLYCVIRGFASGRHWRWYAAAVGACVLGMATKEVMVTAPIIVLVYDRIFLGGSFREIFRRRWGLYAGLGATWGLLAYLTAAMPEAKGVGFDMPYLTVWEYARTQFAVILHYLRLSFWPHPLCLDYAWPPARRVGQILPHALGVAALLAATALALWKRPAFGFLGVWFFLILAPTSSIMPIVDLAFEHRMYLSLAAVVVLVVVGAYLVGERLLLRLGWPAGLGLWLGAGAVAILVAALALLTFLRNRDYSDDLSIWSATARVAPNNPRAHINLGATLRRGGKLDEAIKQYHLALKIDPRSPSAHFNLSNALMQKGRFDEAIEHYSETARLRPRHATTRYRLGVALTKRNRLDEAVKHLRVAARNRPAHAETRYRLALALSKKKRPDEAIEQYLEAVRIDPDHADAHHNLGNDLVAKGRLDEARKHFAEAARVKPDFALAYYGMGLVLGLQEKYGEAVGPLRESIRLNSRFAPAHYNLGVALVQQGRPGQAIQHFAAAVRIDPTFDRARQALTEVLSGQVGQRRPPQRPPGVLPNP